MVLEEFTERIVRVAQSGTNRIRETLLNLQPGRPPNPGTPVLNSAGRSLPPLDRVPRGRRPTSGAPAPNSAPPYQVGLFSVAGCRPSTLGAPYAPADDLSRVAYSCRKRASAARS